MNELIQIKDGLDAMIKELEATNPINKGYTKDLLLLAKELVLNLIKLRSEGNNV